MGKPKIFISHISEEAKLASLLKVHLERDFLGAVDVFVSSESASIGAGKNWLREIEDALKTATVIVILCSSTSISRPWINFEAGGGCIRGVPVVPLCHSRMRPVELPIPLSLLQGGEAANADGLRPVVRDHCQSD
jgi:hypothetical protein